MIYAKEIKRLGKQLGIDEVRITAAEPFATARKRFDQQKQEGLFTERKHRHFEKEEIDDFYRVQSKLPDAKSIITGCQCYLTDEKIDFTSPGNPYGRIARYTWRNHYLDLKQRLGKIAQFISKQYDASFRVYSNGPVAEKPIAQRSGIGYFGKHSIIINKTHGSWIVLGEILTDVEIEPDKPVDSDCGDCHACMDACPTGAIIRPYIIDRKLCIQELTNWLGVIPDTIARVWENRLYGCTTCQEVCPANKAVTRYRPRTNIGYVGSCLPLMDILRMDETEYREKFANNQISANWIHFRAIQRNALIALGNLKDSIAFPLLKELAESHDSLLAQTAQWAIKKFSYD